MFLWLFFFYEMINYIGIVSCVEVIIDVNDIDIGWIVIEYW